MDIQRFASSPCGRVAHARTGYDAFVPDPLPPVIAWQRTTVNALERAAVHVGRLSGYLQDRGDKITPLLIARDAVGGVRSEGASLALAEFFESVATDTATVDAGRLARNYIVAFEHASHRMEELPLSLRLVRELHFLLLEGVADPRSTPGQFRRSQNWLGPAGCTLANAAFVPPPTNEMRPLLDNWEHFLHESDGLPALIRLSLAQYQYLAIHPFLDMNGLVGALTAVAILLHLGMTSQALPIFGRMLERSTHSLQQRVLGTCASGDWENWMSWYLHSIADAARETYDDAIRLRNIRDDHSRRAEAACAHDGARRVLDLLFQRPVLTTEWAAEAAALPAAEASNALDELESMRLVTHSTAHGKNVYAATDIIESLATNPLAAGGYAFPF